MKTYYVSKTKQSFKVGNETVRVRLFREGEVGSSSPGIIEKYDIDTKLAAKAFVAGENVFYIRYSTRYLLENSLDEHLPVFGYFEESDDLKRTLVIKPWLGMSVSDPNPKRVLSSVLKQNIKQILGESSVVNDFMVRNVSGSTHQAAVFTKSETDLTMAAFVLRSNGLLIKEA